MADDLLSAREAAALLNIQVQTLYAYVSRGWLRSHPSSDARRKLYRRDELEALRARKELRRNPGKAVREALHWGAPVLDSAISCIAEGRLYYRGHDAVELARSRRFEAVVGLLWNGALGPPPAPQPLELPAFAAALAELPPLPRLQSLLPWHAQRDPARFDRRPDAVRSCGGRILDLAVEVISGRPRGTAVAAQLAGERGNAVARLLDAALILCADHELNVSAFTARCVASADSSPYDAVLAALAALRGPRHGGHTARVEALFDEATGGRDAVRARLERGDELPGFGHRLYPGGDPRGRTLLQLLAEAGPHPALDTSDALRASARERRGVEPAIDFALVALRRVLGLPEGSALALFALGRLVGWIGHIIEQYGEPMIRPRARYRGRPPASAGGR